MIQFNLLPDIKIEYIKAQRTRRTVLSVAITATVASLLIFGLSFGASQLQKKHLSDLNDDIAQKSKELKGKEGIDKILTVQNQLQSLTALHDAKPAASRVFDYLNQVTPTNVSLSGFTVDFVENKVTIIGSSDSLSSVNKYVDTLKFTTFTVDDEESSETKTPAFSDVVLTSFVVSSKTNDRSGASAFTIDLKYSAEPSIFDIKKKVRLNIPSTISTRSQVDKPTELFTGAPSAEGAN